MKLATPRPLGDLRALVLRDHSLKLQEQLILRRLGPSPFEEAHLRTDPGKLLDQQSLIDVPTGKAVRRVAEHDGGLDFGREVLGFAIGDAAGHGLSAALLVRDVVTGLRMGIEKELKITQVFEKLNRVIHRSRLSSRFVSVFYGELETNGTLVYVNAGHQPPLLFRRGADGSPVDEVELSVGGTVVGPLVEARFRRGFVTFGPRDVLVLCTDGILERRKPAGEFFDVERLRATVHAVLAAPARVILDRLFEAALTFGDGRPWEDDATIVVVTREAGGPAVPDAAP